MNAECSRTCASMENVSMSLVCSAVTVMKDTGSMSQVETVQVNDNHPEKATF